MHKYLGHRIAVQHDRQYSFHRLHLGVIRALLELCLEILQRGLIRCIVLMDEGVGIFQEGTHVDDIGCSGPSQERAFRVIRNV